MIGMNQAETQSSKKKITAGSLMGFLIRSVIAGLALAAVTVGVPKILSDTSAAEYHNGGAYAVSTHCSLGFDQLKLKAQRAQIVFVQ